MRQCVSGSKKKEDGQRTLEKKEMFSLRASTYAFFVFEHASLKKREKKAVTGIFAKSFCVAAAELIWHCLLLPIRNKEEDPKVREMVPPLLGCLQSSLPVSSGAA